MREILFKAKRIDNGEWVEGTYLFCKDATTVSFQNEHYILVFDGYGVVYHSIDKDTICQYTGLTDKNGRKIWEGDIVIYDNSPYNVYCTPKTGTIAFRNECLCFKYWLYGSINYMPFSADLFFDKKCEHIGNIFDNPELLERGD